MNIVKKNTVKSIMLKNTSIPLNNIIPYRSSKLLNEKIVVGCTLTEGVTDPNTSVTLFTKIAFLVITSDLNLNQFSGNSITIKDGFFLDKPCDIVITKTAIYSLWLTNITAVSKTQRQYLLLKTNHQLERINWAIVLQQTPHVTINRESPALTVLQEGDCVVLMRVINDYSIVRIDQELGTVIWSKQFSLPYGWVSYVTHGVKAVTDGVIIITTKNIIKVSSNGNFVWGRRFGVISEKYGEFEFDTGVLQQVDNSIFLSGRARSGSVPITLEIDTAGIYKSAFLLQRTISSPYSYYYYPYSISENGDYLYGIAGRGWYIWGPQLFQLLQFSSITNNITYAYDVDGYPSYSPFTLTQLNNKTVNLVFGGINTLYYFNLLLNSAATLCDFSVSTPLLSSVAVEKDPLINQPITFSNQSIQIMSLPASLFHHKNVLFNQVSGCSYNDYSTPSQSFNIASYFATHYLTVLIPTFCCCFCCCIFLLNCTSCFKPSNSQPSNTQPSNSQPSNLYYQTRYCLDLEKDEATYTDQEDIMAKREYEELQKRYAKRQTEKERLEALEEYRKEQANKKPSEFLEKYRKEQAEKERLKALEEQAEKARLHALEEEYAKKKANKEQLKYLARQRDYLYQRLQIEREGAIDECSGSVRRAERDYDEVCAEYNQLSRETGECRVN